MEMQTMAPPIVYSKLGRARCARPQEPGAADDAGLLNFVMILRTEEIDKSRARERSKLFFLYCGGQAEKKSWHFFSPPVAWRRIR